MLKNEILTQSPSVYTSDTFILQVILKAVEELNIYKRELGSLVDSLRDFLTAFDKASKCYKIHYRNPKLRLDLPCQKTFSLLITITVSLNIQIDEFVYRSDLETRILAFFPLKRLNYTLERQSIYSYGNCQLNHGEIHHLYKNRYYVANKCEIIESNCNV